MECKNNAIKYASLQIDSSSNINTTMFITNDQQGTDGIFGLPAARFISTKNIQCTTDVKFVCRPNRSVFV